MYLRKNKVIWLVGSVASFGWATQAYMFSLAGGDDTYILDQLPALGLQLLLASIFFQLSLYCLMRTRATRVSYSLSVIYFIVWLYIFTLDLGDNFEHHGQYNFAIFWGLTVLIASLVIGIVILLHSPRRRYFLYALLFALALLFVIAQMSKARWDDGISSSFEGNGLEEGCVLDLNVVPWASILPRRYISFFLGSEQCPKVRDSVSQVANDTLYVRCEGNARVIFNPDFVSERNEPPEFEGGKAHKYLPHRLWDALLNKHRSRIIDTGDGQVAEPIEIPSKTQYIQTICEETGEEKLEMVLLREDTRELLEKQKQILKNSKKKKKPNVLIVMIDAVSRLQFSRRLIKTTKWLRKISKSPQSSHLLYEFFRYHVVAFATDGNLVPMLTGLRYASGDLTKYHVMTHFNRAGYVSLWLQSACQDYVPGFFNSNTSFAHHDVVLPFCHPDYHSYTSPYSLFGGGPYSMRRRCITGRPVHQMAFEYTNKFFELYNEVPRIAFVGLNEGHEPSMSVLSTIDKDLCGFLRQYITNNTGEELEAEGDMDETIVMVVSDHGSHGSFYWMFTQGGNLEHHLPVLLLLVPKSFQRRYPSLQRHLARNQQRLVTSFDIYTTLMSILALDEGETPLPKQDHARYAVNLFEEIHVNRTCLEANIPPVRCICRFRSNSAAFSVLRGSAYRRILNEEALRDRTQCRTCHSQANLTDAPLYGAMWVTVPLRSLFLSFFEPGSHLSYQLLTSGGMYIPPTYGRIPRPLKKGRVRLDWQIEQQTATRSRPHHERLKGRCCSWCMRDLSLDPMPRRGPDGRNTLCNVCGLRYRKDCQRVRLMMSIRTLLSAERSVPPT